MTQQLAETPAPTAAKPFAVFVAEMIHKRVTQQDIADLAGRSQATINAIMHGRYVARPTRDAALKAVNALRTSNGLSAISYEDVIWEF